MDRRRNRSEGVVVDCPESAESRLRKLADTPLSSVPPSYTIRFYQLPFSPPHCVYERNDLLPSQYLFA